MTFSLSSLSSDLKVPIVFMTWCYHTPSSKKERMHSLLSYGVSTVKDGIVFPSFHNRDLNIRRRRRQRKHIKNNLISKTTIFHVHHAFLQISLPSLYDYDVKMPHFTLYRGSIQATTKFPLSFCTWMWFLGIQLQDGSSTFEKVSDLE